MRRLACLVLLCLTGCPVALEVDGGVIKKDAGRPIVDAGFMQTKFTITVEVKGLMGRAMVLKVNDINDLQVNQSGTFTFPNTLTKGDSYKVTVGTQPSAPTQTCTVMNGEGIIDKLDIADVVVTCVTKRYAIGGTVVGLEGLGLTLRNNNSDALTLTKNGPFAFPITYTPDSTYEVTIFNQPVNPVQVCTMSGATGIVGNSDVGSVVVNCSSSAHTVGGTVTGLAGSVTVRNNNNDTLTLTANGTFAFGVPIESGNPYSVEVITQPGPNQNCFVDQGIGVVGATDVTTVRIACTTATHFVGGTLTGLGVNPITITNNGSNPLTLTASGTFRFTRPIASGSTYNVQISAQPTTQRCAVTRGTGTIDALDVTSVGVTCANSFSLGVYTIGFTSPLTVRNNGEDLVLNTGGTTYFTDRLLPGETYSITVKTQPSDGLKACTIDVPNGMVTNANVVVAIRCTPLGPSCDDILLANPGAPDGVYFIDPDGAGGVAPFSARCDMTHNGGGWMLVTDALVYDDEIGQNASVFQDVDAFGGVRYAVEANNLLQGVNCDIDNWNAVIFSDVVPWTQVRSTWEFSGNSYCWSIFGNTTVMGANLNLAPFSFAGGDTISQQSRMGSLTTDNFDGVNARCADGVNNFWSSLNTMGTRRATVILHRSSFSERAGVGLGASCVNYDSGNMVSRARWKFSDMWIR